MESPASKIKHILTMSLVGESIAYAKGYVRHGELNIIDIKTVKKGRFRKVRESVEEVLSQAKKHNMVILIEDPTGLYSERGYPLALGGIEPHTGLTYQRLALEEYMNLARLGGTGTTSIPTKEKGKSVSITETYIGGVIYRGETANHALRPDSDSINITTDDSGRPKYDFEDNTGLDEKTRAILMLALAVSGVLPLDEDYAVDLFAQIAYELDEAVDIPDDGLSSTVHSLYKNGLGDRRD